MIDFSVVMTAAVSSIPLQILQQQWNQVQVEFTVPNQILVDDGWFFDSANNASEENYHTLELEDIMPQADSVAGPLIFLGASVLKVQEMVYLPE
ncbi:MAG: hypothetical protein H6765_03930 [Candidatus Peribacteria bacterium]|nr:MAG: hypothetical protein H6765_03930 [Candidatus Peribacteria bacterium]